MTINRQNIVLEGAIGDRLYDDAEVYACDGCWSFFAKTTSFCHKVNSFC